MTLIFTISRRFSRSEYSSSFRALASAARLGGALVVLLMLNSCGGEEPKEEAAKGWDPKTFSAKAPKAIAVEVGMVEEAQMSSLYTTSGHLRAEREAMIIARTEGLLTELKFEEGQRVLAEDVVAILDDTEPRVEEERTKKILEIKQRSFDRSEELQAEGMVSENDFDNSLRELVEAKHAAEMARLRLAYTEIFAPFEGTLIERFTDVGAMVNIGTEMFSLADLDPLYADVRVPERHVSRLQIGQDVRLNVLETDEVAARIERIGPSVDPTNGTVKVTLAVDNPEDVFRPGSFIKVAIVTDSHPKAMVVARSALVAEGHHWNVFRVNEREKKVEKIEVTLGFEEGERVEIASVMGERPLTLGDKVVILGASALTEGAPIKWTEAQGDLAESRSDESASPELGDALGPS